MAKVLNEHQNQIDENLAWLSDNNGGIESLQYYYDLMRQFASGKLISRWKAAGKKVVGIFCDLVPEELVYSAGAMPVRLCLGLGGEAGQEESICPADLCPLIKSSMGMALEEAPLLRLCDLLVIPATCDGKKKLSERLAIEYATLAMDPPHTRDTASAREQWLTQLKHFKNRMELLTGRKITAKGLREAIDLCNHKRALARRLYHMAGARRVWGRDVLLANSASFFDDPSSWSIQTEKLLHDLNGPSPSGIENSRPRLLLTGSPVLPAFWKLPTLIEEAGGHLVADELCIGGKALWEPAHVHEAHMAGLLSAVAERTIMMACACFIPNTARVNYLLQMIRELKVDGVVYHVLRGCHLYGMEVWRIEEVLRKLRVPMLKIETDLKDSEQLRTRLEAFIEILSRQALGEW